MSKSEETRFGVKFKLIKIVEEDTFFERANVVIEKGCIIGVNTLLSRGVVVKAFSTIGENCFIGNNTLIREHVKIGNGTKIGFCNAIEPYATIGNNTRTQGFCMISEYSKIGDNCFIGPHFNSMGDDTIGNPNGKYIANPPIIGNNCRFGSATKIVPGIKIEDGTITGAMSLLTKDTETNTLYYGIPAKKIKKLNGDLKL